MYTKKDATIGGSTAANRDQERPLLQWVQACNEFCAVRNQVNSLIKQRLASREKEPEKKGFVSQCSTAQLILLEMEMTEELERLLGDINRRNSGPFPKKLLKHVAVLQQWNQRAQSLLRLAGQSTC
jgi:hypothetical protein